MPSYPDASALETGMDVKIRQTDTDDELVGQVGAVRGEAEGPGTLVELKSGPTGVALEIGPEE